MRGIRKGLSPPKKEGQGRCKKLFIEIFINFAENIKNNKINENINIQRKRSHQNAGTY